MNRLSGLFSPAGRHPSGSKTPPNRSSTSGRQAPKEREDTQTRQQPQNPPTTIQRYSAFKLSSFASSVTIPEAGYACEDFRLSAGMVIIQPSSGKMVICYDTKKKGYFLPKGRKDIGESLEDTALREAREESGFLQVQHYPLYKRHHQPAPPGDAHAFEQPDTEAIYVSVTPAPPKFHANGRKAHDGWQQLTFWYVGCIEADAVWTKGTGMADEQNYESTLVYLNQAVRLLKGGTADIVQYAYTTWKCHLDTVEAIRKESEGAIELDEV